MVNNVKNRGRKILILGLAVSLLIVILLSPFASSKPDGLERVAEDEGFADKAMSLLSEYVTFFNDYTVSFIKNEKLSTIVAGVVGVFLVFGFSYFFTKLLRRKSS